jgi:hypothetical protein
MTQTTMAPVSTKMAIASWQAHCGRGPRASFALQRKLVLQQASLNNKGLAMALPKSTAMILIYPVVAPNMRA